MDGGSRLLEVLGNTVRLGTDRDRHGQDAFIASPFSRLALTHVLSVAGDALVTLALAGSLFFNISLHSARGRVALSLLLTMAPFAVVAPFLGPIIDRTRGGRKAMVLASAVGRAVACLLMARYIHSLLLFPAAFVTLVCSKGYTVAKAALVPSTVERSEDLVEANSKLAVSGAIAGFIIAIPGVAVLKLLDAAWLLRADAVLFIACAVTSVRLQVAHPVGERRAWVPEALGSAADPTLIDPAPPDGPTQGWPYRADGLAAGLPPGAIQVAAVTMGTLRLLVGFMTFLVAFGFRRDHAAAWWYGLVLASSIGGNLVGAAVAPWLRSRLREEWILLGSVISVASAGILTFAFNAFHGRPAAAMLAAVIGLSAGAAKLAFDALVQRHVPAAAQGRAFGRFEAGFQLVWVAGSLLPVVITMTLWAGFAVVTLAAFVASLVFLAGTQLARLGRLPSWWPGTTPPGGGVGVRRARAIGGGVGVPGSAGRGQGRAGPGGPMPRPADPATVAEQPDLAGPTRELGSYGAAGPTVEFEPAHHPPDDLNTQEPSS